MPDPVRLLALTAHPAAWSVLEEIAGASGWELFWARDSAAALSLIESRSIPILICDRDLDAEDWRAIMRRIHERGLHVSTLLASRVADEYLWREVILHHGFDVLPKPFHPQRLERAIWLAWADVHWR